MQLSHLLACSVLVLAGCRKVDPVYCEHNPGDPGCAGDGGIGGDAGGVTIGGSVTGLTGAGLVLQDNGSDDKQILNSGAFTFPTPLQENASYDVTVSVQPTNPSQDCIVSAGTGTATGDVVSSVKVDCTTAMYSVGGTVVGLSSGTVPLKNGSDSVSAGNGSFMFPMKVASGSMYNVQLDTGAPGTCHVFGNNGTVGNADVTTVVVNCTPNAFTVGGTVTGLNGSVQLTNNGGSPITISANGTYAFPTPVANNGGYNVVVSTQPAYPPAQQMCTVSNGVNTVMGTDVTNVDVNCVTQAFHVSGSSSGVNGTISLSNNGGDTIMQTSSGGFMFPTPVPSGGAYAVTVQSPPMLGCLLFNASGTVKTSDVTNVSVFCGYRDGGIKCGGAFCAAGGGNGCCDPEGGKTCQSSSNSCSGKLYLPCDSDADCGNQKCCVTQGGNGPHPNVASVSCSNMCNGPEMCDPNAPRCPPMRSCRSYSLLPGYYTCQ